MSPEQRKAFDKQFAKANRDTVEMVDGRVYESVDNWQTATLILPSGRRFKLTGESLHLAQFLAVSQSSWAGNAS